MALSVIVTSFDSPAVLERCLSSLTADPAAREIVVADCSAVNPAPKLAARFPTVRFLHFARKQTVPQLRWAAFEKTSGDVVGAIEARCVPARDWCSTIEESHRRFPSSWAVGGPVRCGDGMPPRSMGLYFCEYGRYAPPVEEGISAELSGANLSFKREALLKSRDILESGKWETVLYPRWRKQGREVRLCGAEVTFVDTMPPGIALRQRYWYGRGYAAERVAGSPRLGALARAATSPMLPFVLTWRMWFEIKGKRLRPKFLRAFGWILLYHCAWALGEGAGYLFGPSREARIY